MQQMKTRTIAWALAALVASGAAADSDLWLHVKVDEAEGAKVVVNLPISLVEKALPMIPQGNWHGGRVTIDGHHEWSLAELRSLWQEVTAVGDMTFVTVQDDGEDVKVWKEGDYLKVRATEHDGEGDGSDVNVQIPARVVDALLSGEGDELNFRAAIEALAAEGEGELVTVNGDQDRVRVWVDRTAEAE